MPTRTCTTEPSGSVASCSSGPAWRDMARILADDRTLGLLEQADRPMTAASPLATLGPDGQGDSLVGGNRARGRLGRGVRAGGDARAERRAQLARAGRSRRRERLPGAEPPPGADPVGAADAGGAQPFAANGH